MLQASLRVCLRGIASPQQILEVMNDGWIISSWYTGLSIPRKCLKNRWDCNVNDQPCCGNLTHIRPKRLTRLHDTPRLSPVWARRCKAENAQSVASRHSSVARAATSDSTSDSPTRMAQEDIRFGGTIWAQPWSWDVKYQNLMGSMNSDWMPNSDFLESMAEICRMNWEFGLQVGKAKWWSPHFSPYSRLCGEQLWAKRIHCGAAPSRQMEIAFPMPSCINPIDDQGNQNIPVPERNDREIEVTNSPSPLREAQMCNLQPKELLPKFGICNHLRSHPTALLGNDDLIQHIDFTRVFANSTQLVVCQKIGNPRICWFTMMLPLELQYIGVYLYPFSDKPKSYSVKKLCISHYIQLSG